MHEYEMRFRVTDVFDHLVKQAEDGEAFTITREGKPVAVLIGIEEFNRFVHEGDLK